MNVIVHGSDGREYPFTVPSTGEGLCTWDKIIDLPPGKLLDIGIETDGEAARLSAEDSRVAAFMIRNMSIMPLIHVK